MKNMKIAMALLLSLLMILSCASVAFADGQDSVSATAEAQGLDETVTVTVTVSDNIITDVTAETDKAETTVGAQAIEKLPAAMVENNSVRVDAISGATATSNAVLAAAADAYLQILGADVDLDAWAKGNGYLKAEDYQMEAGVDAITSATVSGVGGINFGDVDLSDELKRTRSQPPITMSPPSAVSSMSLIPPI